MSAKPILGAVRKASRWSILWGILMLFCGILAICLPLATSIGLVIILAWLILLGAISHLIYAFHAQSAGAILWEILVGLLYGGIGIYLLMNPVLGVLSLTLLLGVFLLIEGALEIALYFQIRRGQGAGWVLFDGIVTLVLGLMIWRHWPSSSIWLIGTLMGISLIFSGISRIMLSMAVRRLASA